MDLASPSRGGVTLLLCAVMQSAVATEFTPQPSSRIGVSSTNPYIEIIICDCIASPESFIARSYDIKRPEPVERSVCLYPSLQNPHNDPAPYVAPSFDTSQYIPRVKPLFVFPFRKFDHYRHIHRLPPIVPKEFLEGNYSGYCRLRFDINDKGRPKNVLATECTDEALREASIKSVLKWNYNPPRKTTKRIGVKTIIRFDFLDEQGKLLPLPEGY